jgi:hypothetical protein
MEIPLPPRLRKALEQAERLFGEAHLVGGAVRDLVLGLEPKDLDLATPLPPEEVARRLENARLPVGLSGAAWGTVFTAFQVDGEKVDVEITTYRREIAYRGRHPVVEWTDSVIEDLARRDFTVNAMALDSRGRLIDPFFGLQDMKEGVVRAVGDPQARFEEDPLRVVRALRFAARYGWEIEAETSRAMADTAHLVRERVTLPRLGQEVGKGLLSANPGDFLRGLHELGLLYHLLPELAEGPHGPAHALPQNPAYHPEGDVLSHLFQVVKRARALGSDELGPGPPSFTMWASPPPPPRTPRAGTASPATTWSGRRWWRGSPPASGGPGPGGRPSRRRSGYTCAPSSLPPPGPSGASRRRRANTCLSSSWCARPMARAGGKTSRPGSRSKPPWSPSFGGGTSSLWGSPLAPAWGNS